MNDIAASSDELEFTLLMPCLNEAETLATCVAKALSSLERLNIRGEVVVADNGSTDGSQGAARKAGARVIDVPMRGYGAAILSGIEGARGKYIIMGDADDSYDWSSLGAFVEQLRGGHQLVMGCRLPRGGGTIVPSAMPIHHRWLGNPVLSFIGRLLFRSPITDFHCGLRGFNRDAIKSLGLQTTGMEFASEMVIKATLAALRIGEVPITLSPDGRSRPPHLRSWRDGWRHLRFMLAFSPKWLFLVPGFGAFIVGLTGLAALIPGPLQLGPVHLGVNSMLFFSVLAIVSFQWIQFGISARVYMMVQGLLPDDATLLWWSRRIHMEHGLLLGLLVTVAGAGLFGSAIYRWASGGFGDLSYPVVLRTTIPAVTALALGTQMILGSFFLSILGVPRRRVPQPGNEG